VFFTEDRSLNFLALSADKYAKIAPHTTTMIETSTTAVNKNCPEK
jgi:hypothetical protein